MAKNTFQLNYDEMTAIAKKFKDEGEDIARLHATTRQKVRDLYKEWVGEGADKFLAVIGSMAKGHERRG